MKQRKSRRKRARPRLKAKPGKTTNREIIPAAPQTARISQSSESSVADGRSRPVMESRRPFDAQTGESDPHKLLRLALLGAAFCFEQPAGGSGGVFGFLRLFGHRRRRGRRYRSASFGGGKILFADLFFGRKQIGTRLSRGRDRRGRLGWRFGPDAVAAI